MTLVKFSGGPFDGQLMQIPRGAEDAIESVRVPGWPAGGYRVRTERGAVAVRPLVADWHVPESRT